MSAYGTMRLRGGRWVVEAAPHVAMMLKRVLRRADRATPGKLHMDNTPSVCRDLAWVLMRYPLEMSPEDAAALEASARAAEERVLAADQFLSGRVAAPDVPLALPLRDYQAREVAAVLSVRRIVVGDALGLGKTVVGIGLLASAGAGPGVVFCQTHLIEQWVRMLGRFAPHLLVHAVKTRKPYEIPSFMGRAADVVVCAYSRATGWADILAGRMRTVVADEAQELRRTASDKYRAVKHVADKAEFFLGLTATPVYNYGDEVFAVWDVVAPGALGSSGEFLTEWTVPIGNGKARVKDPRALGAWLRDQGLFVRHTRAEVGRELPPVVRVTHEVDTDRAALDAVDGRAGELARILLDDAPQERGARFQAAEEFSTLLRQATGIAKAPYVAAFVKLLVEQGERVVLVGWHRAVYDLWLKALKDLRVALYTGSESTSAKDAHASAFAAGELDVLILSLRSGAGLDGIQDAARVVVFGELDWSPAVHDQCVGRLHRDLTDGSLPQEPVVVYYLIARDGADTVIADVLGVKADQAAGVIDPFGKAEAQVVDHDRVRSLASAYLGKTRT